MPTGGRRPVLLDTSAAVALVVADHEHHSATVGHLRGRELGLAGHAAFETYSVLTRLPPPNRRPPAMVAELLRLAFPQTCHLSARASAGLLGRLGPLGIAGGSIFDALVAAAAVEHGLVLVSRDRRAAETYRALEVEVDLLGA